MSYLSCLSGINNFEEAKEKLNAKNLIVNSDYTHLGMYLVKYNHNQSDLNDPDVKKCRGLILSTEDNSVICPVPQKSSNNTVILQNYTGNPNKYVVTDFLDGTMINYFQHKGTRYISTRSCIGAKCHWLSEKSFSEMFYECLESTNLKLDSLNMDYCYSFLIQHPSNRIVKQYLSPRLVLTHVSRVVNGNVLFHDVHQFSKENNLDIDVPTKYNFQSIEDMFEYIASLDSSEQGLMVFEKDEENPGYIMDLSRYKIRNMKYNQMKELKGNTNNKHYLFFNLRQLGGGSYEKYILYFEEDQELFESYRQELYSLTAELFKMYLDCFVNKNTDGTPVQIHKEAPFELKPLIAELHSNHIKTRNPTTKNVVIQYLHKLPIPRLLFTINKRRHRLNEHNNVITPPLEEV